MSEKKRKPILCLDFDGVIHSYTSGWQGPRNIPDPPMPGAMAFLREAVKKFEVHIFSSRSHYIGGRWAMKKWLKKHAIAEWGDEKANGHFVFSAEDVYLFVKWPNHKPPALVTIDDRAIQFEGQWPGIVDLLNFKPWKCRVP